MWRIGRKTKLRRGERDRGGARGAEAGESWAREDTEPLPAAASCPVLTPPSLVTV